MADEPLEEQQQEEQGGTEAAADNDWAAAMGEEEAAPPAGATPDFDELGEGVTAADMHNLDFLLDIPLEVTVELGRTTMLINNILQLTQGSVVELDKAAADMVEIYVNQKLLGKGEVIVVNDRFGVRITEIISQADRIKNMG